MQLHIRVFKRFRIQGERDSTCCRMPFKEGQMTVKEWKFIWDVLMFWGYTVGVYMVITGIFELIEKKMEKDVQPVQKETISTLQGIKKRGRPQGAKDSLPRTRRAKIRH